MSRFIGVIEHLSFLLPRPSSRDLGPTYWRGGGGIEPPRVPPIFQVVQSMTLCVFPPGIGNMSPDRPRNAVPATRQIIKIASIMILTSNLMLMEMKYMIRAERAHIISQSTLTYGRYSYSAGIPNPADNQQRPESL